MEPQEPSSLGWIPSCGRFFGGADERRRRRGGYGRSEFEKKRTLWTVAEATLEEQVLYLKASIDGDDDLNLISKENRIIRKRG